MAQRPQLKRPEDNTAEEKPPEPKKPPKVKGPRAVGLLQIGDKKVTLIPVAILVDGRFYDASAYKADPVPMALEPGTVYEVEQEGSSQGLFTVNAALHSRNAGSAHPWTATGAYVLNGTEVPKSTRKAEDVPVGINSAGSDEPPRLTRPAAPPTPAQPAAGAAPGQGTTPASDKHDEHDAKPAASSEAGCRPEFHHSAGVCGKIKSTWCLVWKPDN